jgi:3',5'-cyclic AMP phosphodiesterase CpdA
LRPTPPLPPFTLAHTSDWHATSLAGIGAAELASKRLLGWLSWIYRRQHSHRIEILRAMFADIEREAPDHVAITGDLTNVSLEREFVASAELLRELGPPSWISLVPGNHDSYVAVPRSASWDLWSRYIASDEAREAAEINERPPEAPLQIDFPSVRIRRGVALIGINTAVPTAPAAAWGRVGEAQLQALAVCLSKLGDAGLCRVLLTHHPATDQGYSPRRRLRDSAALRSVLERCGAELVLHGHGHRRQIHYIPGPNGDIPCVGVRSGSHAPEPEHRRAQYHLFRIAPDEGSRFRISLTTRGYDAVRGVFDGEGERAL